MFQLKLRDFREKQLHWIRKFCKLLISRCTKGNDHEEIFCKTIVHDDIMMKLCDIEAAISFRQY